MYLCAGLTAASWILDPFGEIGANFSLQLSSGTQFAKISNKKNITENQCEKDFSSLQSRQNIVALINLDGIVCIPGANVSPCSCSDIKKYNSSSGKALTRLHYLMVSQLHNADMFH